MKITALSTGTLRLKPTFLEGSPAHGDRRTLPRVLSLVRTGIAYLPSHDPESPARLRGGAVVQPTSNVSIEAR
jgi:hypothetical protein